MLLDRGHTTNASLQTEARKKLVPPIEITEAYRPPIIWYDRLMNPSMEGKLPDKVEQTGYILGLSKIFEQPTPHLCMMSYTNSFSPLIHCQCQLQV